MEQKNIWEGKWKYALMVVVMVAAVGVFAYTRISSSAAKLAQKNATSQTAALPAAQSGSAASIPSTNDSSLGGAQDAEAAGTAGTSTDGEVVASKNGTKYFPLTCTGVKNIKEANKVTFPSAAAAEAAGYTLAKNCQAKN